MTLAVKSKKMVMNQHTYTILTILYYTYTPGVSNTVLYHNRMYSDRHFCAVENHEMVMVSALCRAGEGDEAADDDDEYDAGGKHG